MALIYFDCFSGAAGDMIIGALLDAGLPLDALRAELGKLNLSGYEISANRVQRNHIAATKFDVHVAAGQPHRSPKQITEMIASSSLASDVREKATRIFARLAEAEATAHGEPVERVHFHEVGAVDAIVDIVGAVVGLTLLGIDQVFSSPLPLGAGSVSTMHGPMPVPAPATAVLTDGFPVKMTSNDFEMTTPTGAAILTALATFSDPGEFIMRKVGYGAGSKESKSLPNLLRVMIGEPAPGFETDTIAVLESNLDRITSENLGALLDNLMAAGALDVFITPIIMKKNRPAHLLSVLCEPDKKDKLARIVFGSGSTLGIREGRVGRLKLARRQMTVATSGGDVSVKVAELNGRRLIFPEHDDMAKAMKKAGSSYDDIYFEIQRATRGDETKKE